MREVKYGEVNPGDTIYPDGITGTGYKVVRTIHEGSANGTVRLIVRHPAHTYTEEWERRYNKLIQRATPQEIAEQAADTAKAIANMTISKLPVTTVHEPTRTRILQYLRRRRRELVDYRTAQLDVGHYAVAGTWDIQIKQVTAIIDFISRMTEEAPDA